jgi:hypothetical protein
MDVFGIAIPGTGYPLSGGYDGLLEYLCITMRVPAWERYEVCKNQSNTITGVLFSMVAEL